MPVDQTGENVLFVMDGETVEAHVQIQYTGDPMRFAWVVPMPAVPTVEVGSQLLFQNLLGGTVPSFNLSTQRDFCGLPGAGGALNLGTGGTSSSAAALREGRAAVRQSYSKRPSARSRSRCFREERPMR